MHVEPFDPDRFASRRQLFDDDLCRDPMVAFHGTSSLSEVHIEEFGLCSGADAIARDEVRDRAGA